DDRDERAGVKFKDADLLGIPVQLVLGKKSLARGVVEAKSRRSGEKAELALETFLLDFERFYENVVLDWQKAARTTDA
ncbi:MAG: hypothetical protein IK079_05150, partial [Desulfovibrio sp.]|nr:hypothetical protein [Desulfovibrio sp.]